MRKGMVASLPRLLATGTDTIWRLDRGKTAGVARNTNTKQKLK